MTNSEIIRLDAYRSAASSAPIITSEDIAKRARELDGDFRAITTIEEVERRVGITRGSDFRGLQQGEVIVRFHQDGPRAFTIGQSLVIASVVGGAFWAVIGIWAGWW